MSRLDILTKSLVDTYAKKLDDQQKKDLLDALDVLAKDAKYNVFGNTFPDTGEFSIHKYPKHKEFFDATANYTEVAMVAGNRVGKCLSYRTPIDLSDGTKELAGVIFDNQIPVKVMAWNGERAVEAEVTAWIKKKPETIYRIWLDNGEWFECAANHRVLLRDGSWHFVDSFLSQLPCLPQTTEELVQKVQYEDVQNYLKTLQDSLDDCQEDHHCDDGQLLSFPRTFPGTVQLPNGVQLHIVVWLQKDGQDYKCICICPDTLLHLSNRDEEIRASGLSTYDLIQDALRDVEQSFRGTKAKQLYDSVESLYRTTRGKASHQNFSIPLLSPFGGVNRVIAYSVVGINDIYDFTVEPHHNYISHGIVHHNSVAGAFATTCHATGKYPAWWTGKRFHKPIMIWVGGDTSQTCRDIIQYKLLGDIGDFGSGMIPKDDIVETKTRRNIPDAIETIRVKHISGGVSTIVIKTYEQGRQAWQGTEVDHIWIDEECPNDVYGEAIIRLMTTKGTMMLTFTPLSGLTDLVVGFLDNDQHSDNKYPKFVSKVSWYDVPHLSADQIAKMLEATPENMRAARSLGDPTVGDGLIYPLPLDQVVIDDFKLPKYFPRAYGMDVGWNATAAIFGAWDRDNDIIYIYSEYKQGKSDPLIHAAGIRARGTWMRGAIDPASRMSGQADGNKLFETYSKSVERGGGGLKLILATNAVESGIFNVWERLQTGRLKIFKSCNQLTREYCLYHRKDGKIVKTNDHLLDSLRYLVNSDYSIWKTIEQDSSLQRQKVVDIGQYMNACV